MNVLTQQSFHHKGMLVGFLTFFAWGSSFVWNADSSLIAQSSSAQDLCTRALSELRSGALDKAIASYSEAIKLEPRSPLGWVGRSIANAKKNATRLKTETGKQVEAISKQIEDDYVKAFQLHPDPLVVYEQWGGEKANAEIIEFMKLIEPIAATHALAGINAIMKDKWEDGFASLNRAVNLFPDKPIYRYQRGFFRMSRGQYDGAISDFNELERIHNLPRVGYRSSGPDLASDDKTRQAFYHLGLEQRGCAYREKGDYRKALTDLNEVIRLSPTSGAYFERGVTYLRQNKNDRAISDLGTAVHLDPKNSKAFAQRAVLLNLRKEHDKAITDIEIAIRLAPSEPKNHYVRGLIHLEMMQTEQAIRDFDEALRLAPKFLEAYHQRGRAYFILKDCDHSIADLTEAIRLSSNRAEFYQLRSQAYDQKGDALSSHADAAKAMQLQPPQINRSIPPNNATQVDPSISEIVVVFDRPMQTDGWSVMPVAGTTFPTLVGQTPLAFRDNETVVLKVALKPDVEYVLGYNTGDRPGFVSFAGSIRAKPFVLRFKTAAVPSVTVVDGPRIIKTDPANGSTNLEAGTIDLTIVFDEPMKPSEASLIVPAGAAPLKVVGKPKWKDARTWIVPVILAPGTMYKVGINTGTERFFVSAGDGTPARSYEWNFRTE